MAKKKLLFYISRGHDAKQPNGLIDKGAVSGKFVEADLAKDVADECYKYLLNYKNRGFKVLYREKKKGMNLWEHVQDILYYQKKYRTVFVDIHFNAGRGDGAEVFIQPEPKLLNKLGAELANNVLKEFKKIGQNSRGIKTGDFMVTNIKKGVNIIVECGFVDNKTDRKGFDTLKERKAYGRAIAKACVSYYKEHK